MHFRHPGAGFLPFHYPRNQSYTLLKTGEFESLAFPLNDAQRLQSAVDAALAGYPSELHKDSSDCAAIRGTIVFVLFV